MQRISLPLIIVLAFVLAALPAGCDRKPATSKPPAPGGGASPPPTNRVDIPAAVRQNLGITFSKVESRAVSRTLRVPGRFELMPTARREYRASMPGKIEVLVAQYQPVEVDTPLFRIESPRWRQMQGEINDARAAMRLAQAGADSIAPLLAAHEEHHKRLEEAVTIWTQRLSQLEELQKGGTVRADDLVQAKASLATVRAAFTETLEKEAGLAAKRTETAAQLESAKARYELLLATAAAMSGHSVEQLAAETAGVPGVPGVPLWRTLSSIEVRAVAAGLVEALHVTSGAWMDENAPLIETVQPRQVRFRARALQSDLGRLSDGLAASIVSPAGGTLSTADAMTGTLALAPTADADRRTIELIVTPAQVKPWARAGVSAFVEVTVAGGEREELAIPLACIARDGTQFIIFRRDPRDPDKAIRMEADLGMDDGRWVVIRSGVKEGDEIVSDGVYQLMVATSGSITKGGHFHPDGTFHEGEH